MEGEDCLGSKEPPEFSLVRRVKSREWLGDTVPLALMAISCSVSCHPGGPALRSSTQFSGEWVRSMKMRPVETQLQLRKQHDGRMLSKFIIFTPGRKQTVSTTTKHWVEWLEETLQPLGVLFLNLGAGYIDKFTLWKIIKPSISDLWASLYALNVYKISNEREKMKHLALTPDGLTGATIFLRIRCPSS